MAPLGTAYFAILVLNALWFGAGFRFFSLTPQTAARLLVPRSARDTPAFVTLGAAVRFLGGMNFALAAFSVLLLFQLDLFPDPRQRALFAIVFALAHGSQFVYNVPVALAGGRQEEAYWPVLQGTMLFIFVVDAALMLANAVLGGWLYWL